MCIRDRGNTAIDALKTTVRDDYTHEQLEWASDSRPIMITAHRRENLGEPMRHMFKAIKRIIDEHPDIKAIYPIHMNPVVRETANEILGDCDRIRIIEPLEVLDFHNFLSRSYLILTDSGGIQEEAPSLGKPVLVMRDTTERDVYKRQHCKYANYWYSKIWDRKDLGCRYFWKGFINIKHFQYDDDFYKCSWSNNCLLYTSRCV